MPQLQSLKSAGSLEDIANLLRFKPKALSYILYKKPDSAKYRDFPIAKRRGGHRLISAPSEDLALLQRRLSTLLQDCVTEINGNQNWKDQLSHGFKRNRSIITNATRHKKKKYVFNVDLENFFGTINFGRVRGFFLKDKNFALHERAATVIAQIACHKNVLPQGAPSSPAISNLVAHILDIHLSNLSFMNGCTYSRYADDLSFSTNKADFPLGLARRISPTSHEWIAGDTLEYVIKKSGFSLNASKTRMQYRNSRQEVTGLVVNSKANIRHEYRHTVRAMAQNLFINGAFEFLEKEIDPTGATRTVKKQGTLDQLHGMLGHIDSVDRHNLKLQSQAKSPLISDLKSLKSKEHLYRRFLLFKEFYAAGRPTIVCEGKTDNIYIEQAIRKLAATYPTLVAVDTNGKAKLNVRLFRYPETSTGRILRLRGGSGDLKNFISQYTDEIRRFKAPGKKHPIILLIDNDSGSTPIYEVVKNITKTKPTGDEPFLHVEGNLYVLAIPKNAKAQSVIEDCFSDQTKSSVINGKTFNPDNGADMSKHYGKGVFSNYVASNANQIDFHGFAQVLTHIAQLISFHYLSTVP